MEETTLKLQIDRFKQSVQAIMQGISTNKSVAVELHTGPDICVIHILFDNKQEAEMLLMIKSIKEQYENVFPEIETYHNKSIKKIEITYNDLGIINTKEETLQQLDIVFIRQLA